MEVIEIIQLNEIAFSKNMMTICGNYFLLNSQRSKNV